MQRYKSVEDYLDGHVEWRPLLERLCNIMNACEVEETVKWGQPCYTHAGKNVVGIGAFKEFVSVWFFQGALLRDEHGVLVNAQEGRTRAMRQWRFQAVEEIDEPLLRAYVDESIENQRLGKEIKAERKKPVEVPDELAGALADDRDAGERFSSLTPGKQREYTEYIAEAKRTETRTKRLEKILPMIRSGQGLNDKYKR
ncbi:MAG: YdeI/OmpD-associated family protein [Gemmatimonadetes bacterium]|nr:YdeI/OmpD-associated family protein [Gemmatimonadota bacterium]